MREVVSVHCCGCGAMMPENELRSHRCNRLGLGDMFASGIARFLLWLGGLTSPEFRDIMRGGND